MVFSNNLLMGAAGQASGYEIDQSIRFDKTASSHLSNTYVSAGNRKTWTFSTWFKRGKIDSTRQSLFAATGQAYLQVGPDAASREMITILNEGSGTDLNWYTTQVFRDPAAWYHLVWQFDTTQADANNRTKLYINGSQVTDFTKAATPAQNFEGAINNAVEHKIGEIHIANYYFDGYQAEINFIDGTALDPTSFGEYNANGVWVPIEYTGSYGTNGFYITGEDSTFLGQDVRTSGDQVNSFQASQYTGAPSDYTFSDGRVEADTSNRAIRTVDTFTGDFEFTWRYVNMANFGFGLYEIDEDGTFSSTSSVGNMQNMTDSWYIKTSSVSANRDILYGSTVVVNATTIANGDVWKMTRESGVIKIYRNDSLIHTFTQTSTNEVRLVISQGDATADANQIAWIDNSTLGNNFFSSGLATTDQMSDTPTLNYATFNPLNVDAYTLSDGNLNTGAAGDAGAVSTFAIDVTDSDGFYFEVSSSTAATYPDIGLQDADDLALAGATTISGYNTGRYTYQGNTGNFNDQGSTSSYGTTYTTNTIGVLVQSGNLYFSKDGTIQNSGTAAKTGLTGMMYARVSYSAGSGTHANFTANFGQSAFTHDPGGTYKAWNTASLPTPSIKDGSKYFQPALYTGTTGAQDITFSGNSDLAPDWLWFKARNAASNHFLFDKIRGALKTISSDDNTAEVTSTGSMTAFGTDGFSLGDGGSDNDINGVSGTTYVAWGWAANGSGSSNEDGATTSTVSASATSGFSIVKWTGTGANTTLGHGLGVAPQMILVKNLADADSWVVYHEDVGATKGLTLDTTAASTTASTFFNNTAPTSSVFSVGSGGRTNGSSDGMIAYCFAEVEGYSSIGSYKGNGSTDGTFVYTGFKPAFVMFKVSTNAPTGWAIIDNKRSNPFNPTDGLVQPDQSGAEGTGDDWDILSNGFKVRTTWAAVNGNGYTVTYMAFAENPFGGDGVAPATAR